MRENTLLDDLVCHCLSLCHCLVKHGLCLLLGSVRLGVLHVIVERPELQLGCGFLVGMSESVAIASVAASSSGVA